MGAGYGDMGGAFLELRRVALSFEGDRTPAEENELIAIVRSIGAPIVPTCLRELGGDDEARWRWAYRLLCELARSPLRDRIGRTLAEVVSTQSMADDTKVRAIAILAEADLPLPGEALLLDPTGARQASVAELASCIHSREDLARAADHLVDTLNVEELGCFAQDLVEAAPVVASAVLDELLIRDDIDEEFRQHLRFMRGSLPKGAARKTAIRGPRAMIGRHGDNRRLVMAWERTQDGLYRALCTLIGSHGVLVDAHYRDCMSAEAIETDFLAPLKKQGFSFRRVAVASARRCLAAAAMARAEHGERQPRAFFVGRDLFGLHDEHLPAGRRLHRSLDLAAVLNRALDWVAEGEYEVAKPHLEAYVRDVPGDADARCSLAVCLMELDDAEGAVEHLRDAVEREPQNALYRWNLASAAHRAGHVDECCEQLRRYLELDGTEPARVDLARNFVLEHERLASSAAQ